MIPSSQDKECGGTREMMVQLSFKMVPMTPHITQRVPVSDISGKLNKSSSKQLGNCLERVL